MKEGGELRIDWRKNKKNYEKAKNVNFSISGKDWCRKILFKFHWTRFTEKSSIQFIEKIIYVLGVSINELLQEETSLAAEQYDEEWLEIVKETMESGMIKEHLKNT